MLFKNKLTVAAAALAFLSLPARAGSLVYIESDGGAFGTLNLQTGALQQIGPGLTDVGTGLVQQANGSLLTLGYDGTLDSINPVTGVETIGPQVLGDCSNYPLSPCGPNSALAFGSLSGSLYATDFAGNLYTINPVTGQATKVGSTGLAKVNFVPGFPNPATGTWTGVDESLFTAGGKLFANEDFVTINPNSPNPVVGIVLADDIYQIDTATGQATLVAPTLTPLNAFVNENGTEYGFDGNVGEVVSLNVTNGNWATVSTYDPTVGPISGAAPVVPEPSSGALIGIGMGLVFVCMCRRRRDRGNDSEMHGSNRLGALSRHVDFSPRRGIQMHRQRKLIISIMLFAATASADTLVYAVSTNYNNFTGQFGTVNVATGAFNQIGPAIADPLTGLVAGPNGTLLSISASGNLDSVNPAAGVVSVIGAISVIGTNQPANAPYSIAELNGTVYATDLYGNLYSLSTTTGAAKLIGATGIPICPSVTNPAEVSDESLFTANGKLYATFDGINLTTLGVVDSPELYQINPATGVGTLVGSTALGLDAAVQVDGTVYGFAFGYAGSNTVLSLNVANGNTTFLNDYVSSPVAGGGNSFDIEGATPTPEPGSISLLAIGVAGVLVARRRRFHSQRCV